jgi:hypothetical protein
MLNFFIHCFCFVSLRSMLYKLLKHTCLNCHQFKMGRQEVSLQAVPPLT